MEHNSKIMPDEEFPEDLTTLEDMEVQVLNIMVPRVLDAEYIGSNPEPETEGRLEELTAELDRRDAITSERSQQSPADDQTSPLKIRDGVSNQIEGPSVTPLTD